MDVQAGPQRGRIEVITGTMFGGKTSELQRRLERAIIANQSAVAFSKDQRFSSEEGLVSHKGNTLRGYYVEDYNGVVDFIDDHPSVEVIGIDEVQFFDSDIISHCHQWALDGKRIIVSGLDQDYNGEPFMTTLKFMAEAEYVNKVLAICTKCGNPALRNHLTVESKERIVEGAGDLYEAICRNCYNELKE